MSAAEGGATCLLWLPISLLAWACRTIQHRSRRPRVWYEFFSELLSLIPFDFGLLARRMFYERTLDGCGRNLCVRFGALLSFSDITIGDNVLINRYTIIGLVDIGDNVMIASHCSLLGGRYQHRASSVEVPIREQGEATRRIHIGDDVWIGAGAVVMADVGQRSIVGAGAVVVDDVPQYSVAVGNPARVVRTRNSTASGSESPEAEQC